MFDYRRISFMKSSVISTISFVAIFFLVICANSFISNISFHSVTFENKKITHRRFKSSSSHIPLLSVIEETTEDDTESNDDDLIPPYHLTEEERIVWFRERLPQLKLFKLTPLTLEFDERIRQFFHKGCEIQLFMTWIFPADSFGKREFYSMESLFKSHPNGCLMILSKSMDSRLGFKILKPLLNRGFHVIAITPNFPFLVKNTPAERWFDELMKGNVDPGEIPLAQNLSNLLRLVVLYKYGGIYLDTDFIILKNFSALRNSIGAQSMGASTKNWTRLNNAVLIFDKKHPLLYKFIEEFALSFDGNKWGYNGPYLVSRVTERMTIEEKGYNITVLPPLAFYPVDWNRIGGLFKKPVNRVTLKWVKAKLLQLSEETYGVHLWNKQSRRLRIEEGSIISTLISEHCVICENIYTS